MTAWLFSSSLTIARQASDDRTSVGRKCLRANVLLPDPLGPIRTTRDSLGMEMCMKRLAYLWSIAPVRNCHCQSSNTNRGTRLNSVVLCVTRVKPLAKVMAAISRLLGPMS